MQDGDNNLKAVLQGLTDSLALTLNTLHSQFEEAASTTCQFIDLLDRATTDVSQKIQLAVSEADTCITEAYKVAGNFDRLDALLADITLIKSLVSKLETDVSELIYSHPKSRLYNETKVTRQTRALPSDFNIAQGLE